MRDDKRNYDVLNKIATLSGDELNEFINSLTPEAINEAIATTESRIAENPQVYQPIFGNDLKLLTQRRDFLVEQHNLAITNPLQVINKMTMHLGASKDVEAQKIANSLNLEEIAKIEAVAGTLPGPLYDKARQLLAVRKEVLIAELGSQNPDLVTARHLQVIIEEYNKEAQVDADITRIEKENKDEQDRAASAHDYNSVFIQAPPQHYNPNDQKRFQQAMAALQTTSVYPNRNQALTWLTRVTNKLVANVTANDTVDPEIKRLTEANVLKLIDLGGWPENKTYLSNLAKEQQDINPKLAQKINDHLLKVAFEAKDYDKVSTLIQEGRGNPNQTVNRNQTSQTFIPETFLHRAIRTNDSKMLNILLEAPKLNLNAFDELKNTALGLEVEKQNPNIGTITKLIEKGANVNIHDERGETVLILAAKTNKKDALDTLLKNGANPNIQDRSGRTALMYAAAQGNAEMVQKLLLSGADPYLKDENGKSAIGYAEDRVARWAKSDNTKAAQAANEVKDMFDKYANVEKQFKENFIESLNARLEASSWFLKGNAVQEITTDLLVQTINATLNDVYKPQGQGFADKIRPNNKKFDGIFELSFVEDFITTIKAAFKLLDSDLTYQKIKFAEVSKVIYDKLRDTKEFKQFTAPTVAMSFAQKIENERGGPPSQGQQL
jgi:ankyrin repeat protein